MVDKKPAGRPTKYKKEFDKQAFKLCKLGAINDDLADFFSVNVDTIYEWQNKHPSFSEAIKEAKQFSNNEVEKALYKRAIGHDVTETTQEESESGMKKKTVTKHVADTAAMIFWLKNRMPDKWRDKQEVDMNAKISSADSWADDGNS